MYYKSWWKSVQTYVQENEWKNVKTWPTLEKMTNLFNKKWIIFSFKASSSITTNPISLSVWKLSEFSITFAIVWVLSLASSIMMKSGWWWPLFNEAMLSLREHKANTRYRCFFFHKRWKLSLRPHFFVFLLFDAFRSNSI